jgi:hypothetical protein
MEVTLNKNKKMKRLTTTNFLTVLVGLSLFLSACEKDNTVKPSVNVTTQDRTIEDYSGIEISTAFTVDVTFSSTEEKIIIEANDNLHAYIDVIKSGNNLIIKIKDNINIQGNSTLKAHITTGNTLDEIFVAEASLVTLNNQLDATDFTVGLAGASFLNGPITAQSITVFADGASNLTLQGTADTFTVNAAGASLVGSFDMITQNANLQLSGASNASITVNGIINLTASGASIFTFIGTGVVNHLDLSGGSQIVKAD